ncbi:methyltransferase [Mycobacterium sp. 852002-53434_SCH5985345]|uniref:class I SAM-dependent methyltransferase n=1 Tax=unclassified Mycobacterium TaxID=2642494 RepID=UPI0008005A0E|nr:MULTISPECIES: class I SAM-dependent methyltransferase [unclassified Mycobacterium]OBF51446.1 methyltransferase [Mycobacterium sp. 852002-53434_SCH5985345]OBF72557.1 methyltransferase [Mycobacterium sp. 852002-51613_SCH5001154]
MALTLKQARAVYNRIGRIQDWQAFYEDATTDRLVANAALAGGQTIFEFGCGTGRLAARLLETLPAGVNYLGVDISPVMINIATGRLAAWSKRASAVLVDGSLPLPADGGSADRVLSTFVFDLLAEDYARAVLDDLRRILKPDGRLCLASLSYGDQLLERAVCRAWTGLWRLAPQLVGGCRPITVSALLDHDWRIQHHSRVHQWGLVTEVVIATPSTYQQ